MKLSKQVVIGWLMSAIGVLGTLGVDLPADAFLDLINTLFSDAQDIAGKALSCASILAGALMIGLRKINVGQLAAGVRGLLGEKTTAAPATAVAPTQLEALMEAKLAAYRAAVAALAAPIIPPTETPK